MGASNITLASTVTPGTNATLVSGTAAVAITAGQVVYFDDTTKTYKLAIGSSAAAVAAKGWAMNTAAANQPVSVLTDGDINGASGLSQGKVYVVSDNVAGAMMLASDLATGHRCCVLGVPSSATVFKSKIYNPVVAVP